MKKRTSSAVPPLPPDQQGKAIKETRTACMWTQTQLANHSGVSQSQISLAERGDIVLGDLDLEKIWRPLRRRFEELYSTKKEAERLGLNILAGGEDLKKWSNMIRRQMAAGKEQDAAAELKARRFHRQRLGLSESAMAERIGVTVTQVRRWERGVIELDPEAQERWNREVTVGDPYFRAETAFDFAKELSERSEKQRRELADLNERVTQLEERNSTLEELTSSLRELVDKLLQFRTADQVLIDEYEKALPEKMQEIDNLRAHREKLTAKK